MNPNSLRAYGFGLSLLLLAGSCRDTPDTSPSTEPRTIASYFPENRPKVLVVGTFHMDYPGLDALKTEESDQIDVLRDPKKSELDTLIAYLEKFRPNKIAIEAHPEWHAMDKYREYRSGLHRDQRDERFQIGMRLADRFHLDTLFSVDAGAVYEDWYARDSAYVSELGADYDFRSDDPVSERYMEWFRDDQARIKQTPLKDYFLEMNSPESHRYDYGAYLIGDFKLGENRGADMLALYWYSRNLRIFRNLQRAVKGPDDRILVVVGNGHAAVLRQLFEASPEFDFVELSGL